MVSSYAAHAFITLTAPLLSWGLVYWVWRRAADRTGHAMLAAVLGQALWMTLAAAKFFAWSKGVKYRLALLGFAFGWMVPLGWFLFAMYYTDRRHLLTRRVWTLIGGVAAVNLGTLLTDPYHGLAYDSRDIVDSPFRHLVLEPSTLWIVSTACAFSIMSVGVVILLYAMVRSRRVSRRQPLLIAVALLPNLAVYTAQNFGFMPVDGFEYTGVTWILFAGVLGYTYFDQDLLRVTPVTRGTVMESVSDAIVVVDETERIVDFNQAAAELFPLTGRIGDPLADVVPALIDDTEPTGYAREITRVVDGDRLHLRVEAAPTSDRDGPTGYTLSVRDITALRQRTESLEQQTEQLEQFASVVSHDLRNPLSVAHGYVTDLRHRIEDGEAVDDPDRLDDVEVSLERMETIIDDALTLAREGQAIEERSVVSLRTVVEDAWRTTAVDRTTLDATGARGVEVYADADRLQTMFENLFRNSIEHGGETVTVRVGTVEDGFYVEDDGPGIPEENREMVFQSGFTTGGTGLGLAIVDNIVDAHGWTVAVGDGTDGGARFVVSGVDILERATDDGDSVPGQSDADDSGDGGEVARASFD